jgi:hypothetical protein
MDRAALDKLTKGDLIELVLAQRRVMRRRWRRCESGLPSWSAKSG